MVVSNPTTIRVTRVLLNIFWFINLKGKCHGDFWPFLVKKVKRTNYHYLEENFRVLEWHQMLLILTLLPALNATTIYTFPNLLSVDARIMFSRFSWFVTVSKGTFPLLIHPAVGWPPDTLYPHQRKERVESLRKYLVRRLVEPFWCRFFQNWTSRECLVRPLMAMEGAVGVESILQG